MNLMAKAKTGHLIVKEWTYFDANSISEKKKQKTLFLSVVGVLEIQRMLCFGDYWLPK